MKNPLCLPLAHIKTLRLDDKLVCVYIAVHCSVLSMSIQFRNDLRDGRQTKLPSPVNPPMFAKVFIVIIYNSLLKYMFCLFCATH